MAHCSLFRLEATYFQISWPDQITVSPLSPISPCRKSKIKSLKTGGKGVIIFEDLHLSKDCGAAVPILRSKNTKPSPGLQTLDVMRKVYSAWNFRCQEPGWSWRLIWGERELREAEARELLGKMSLEHALLAKTVKTAGGSIPTCAGEGMRGLRKKKLVLGALRHWGESAAEVNPVCAGEARQWENAPLRPCSDMVEFVLDRRQKVWGAFDSNAFSQSACITLLPLPGKLTACQQSLRFCWGRVHSYAAGTAEVFAHHLPPPRQIKQGRHGLFQGRVTFNHRIQPRDGHRFLGSRSPKFLQDSNMVSVGVGWGGGASEGRLGWARLRQGYFG